MSDKRFKAIGMCGSPEHNSWRGMKERCTNPNYKQYGDYGGRGIDICESWMESFANFYNDMGDRPSDKHTLERVDNDLGYGPDNCIWATRESQNKNKRVYKNNKHRIPGVYWLKSGNLWTVEYGGRYLGCTKDFFEACCLRKSAEQKDDMSYLEV